MTNENNNNLLVTDDDPTAELEAIALQMGDVDVLGQSESGENTFDFDKRAAGDAKKINSLEFEIETLRSKSLGLEAELEAREELTADLNARIDDLRDQLEREQVRVEKRDLEIEKLEIEIRDRDEQYTSSTMVLEEQLENARLAVRDIPDPPSFGHDADDDPAMSARLRKSEDYADTLRRKLMAVLAAHDESDRARHRGSAALEASEDRVRSLEAELAMAVEEHNRLDEKLAAALAGHVEEIRILRYELGEAQDTVVQAEELSAQLASDLVDTRGFNSELERRLSEADDNARVQIDSLESQLLDRNKHIGDLKERLDGRNEAVKLLFAELARGSEPIRPIEEIGKLVADTDDGVSEPVDDPARNTEHAEDSQQKVSRVLLGRIGDKMLRFPLFKDRLTIGRSAENDIQLEANYVSRSHAVVATDGESTRVIDCGSRNGVYVNSERVSEHLLASGDILTIGNAHFRYDELPRRDA